MHSIILYQDKPFRDFKNNSLKSHPTFLRLSRRFRNNVFDSWANWSLIYKMILRRKIENLITENVDGSEMTWDDDWINRTKSFF